MHFCYAFYVIPTVKFIIIIIYYYDYFRFPGFKEARMVQEKQGIAFVEFNLESEATVAMNNLQNFKISPTHSMIISYAKK